MKKESDTLRTILWVEPALCERMGKLCMEADPSLPRDQAVFDEEVTFSDGMRMAVQVISPTQPELEPCWTQGVLFDEHGCERGCTEVGERFCGEYSVLCEGMTYTVEVCAGSRSTAPTV